MMRIHHGLILSAVVLATACSNKLSSDITVNGEKLVIDGCRSGRVFGFIGVSVTAKSGMRIAIAQTQTGQGAVVVFPSGAAVGTELGLCGPFSVSDQSSTINDVKNVEGKAQLDCEADGFALKGTIEFSNCH